MAGTETPKVKYRELKVFNDPVHGHLEFDPLLVEIIDTPQFQRLRFIKQLGGVYFVYPGAAHNRFEHCLGVCHLAGRLVRTLKEKQGLGITERDILCVEIAGLCHDLGHGPFSHVFDKDFIKRARPGIEWKHEIASEHMFDHMVEKNNLGLKSVKRPEQESALVKEKNLNLTEEECEFIKRLISGKRPEIRNTKLRGDKAFLYDIVANSRNGVDVDKWDYFKRDCHHLGITSSFDHNRLIQCARVIEVDVGDGKREQQICFRDKVAYNIYEMFQTRFALHRKAYQHRIVHAVEIMLVDAMLEADGVITILRNNGTCCKISECIDEDKMDAYTNLTDEIFHQILNCELPAAEKAKKLLNNIMKRELYECVWESPPTTTNTKKPSDILTEVVDMTEAKGETKDQLRKAAVVQIAYLDFGKKADNPVDAVRFYSKSNPNVALPFSAVEVSHLIPRATFNEQIIRLFVRPAEENQPDLNRHKVLQTAFKTWCDKNIQDRDLLGATKRLLPLLPIPLLALLFWIYPPSWDAAVKDVCYALGGLCFPWLTR